MVRMRSPKVYLMDSRETMRESPQPTCDITTRLEKEMVIAEPNGTLVTSSVVIKLGPRGGLLDATLMQLVGREEG
jgi:hypothetical protein